MWLTCEHLRGRVDDASFFPRVINSVDEAQRDNPVLKQRLSKRYQPIHQYSHFECEKLGG